MIDYAPFWETLKNSPENWYTLTSRHHLSHSTLHRLKHNKDISTKTINDLCRILDCPVEGKPSKTTVNLFSYILYRKII